MAWTDQVVADCFVALVCQDYPISLVMTHCSAELAARPRGTGSRYQYVSIRLPRLYAATLSITAVLWSVGRWLEDVGKLSQVHPEKHFRPHHLPVAMPDQRDHMHVVSQSSDFACARY